MKALEYLLNFRTNKAVMGDTNGQMKVLRTNVLDIGTSIGKVQRELTKFSHSQKWTNISNLASNAFSGISGIAGSIKNTFSSVYGFMDEMAGRGDTVAKTSRLLGLSAMDYQALGFAADRSGISIETLNNSLKRFNVLLGKAKSGDETSRKIFGALLPKDVSTYSNTRDVILDVADAYSKLNAEQRAFVSGEVFGRGNLQIAELLSGGSEGVTALIDEYKALGGGFSDSGAKNAEAFKDALSNMNVTLNAMKIIVAEELFPVFRDLFGETTKYFVSNREEIRKTIKNFSGEFATGFRGFVSQVPKALKDVKTIVSSVAGIVGYIGPIKAIVGVSLVGSLGSIVSMTTALVGLIGGPAVVSVAAVAAGIASWIPAITEVWSKWDQLSSDYGETFKAIGLMALDGLKWPFETAANWLNTSLYYLFVRPFEYIGRSLNDILCNSVVDGILSGAKSVIKKIPVIGDMIFSDVDFSENDSRNAKEDLSSGMQGSSIASSVSEIIKNTSTTTTNRFEVAFKDVPRGTKITAPKSGDFDYSYGYVLGGM